MNQKEIKRLKKRIVSESAINVGYYTNVLHSLPSYSIAQAVKNISTRNYVNNDMKEAEIINILVTEAVREINYQDFKDIKNLFFHTPENSRESDRLTLLNYLQTNDSNGDYLDDVESGNRPCTLDYAIEVINSWITEHDACIPTSIMDIVNKYNS